MLKNLKRWGAKEKKVASVLRSIKDLKATEVVCLIKDSTFPTGLLKIVVACLKKHEVKYKIDDNRIRPEPYLSLPWNNKPHTPRYYQKDAIEKVTSEGRAVFEVATGAGKTLIFAYIIKNWRVRTLIVVPSSSLSLQLYNNFRIWFGATKVALVTTKDVRKKKVLPPIQIITIQSLTALKKSKDLKFALSKIEAVLFDEIHNAASKSYTDLLPFLGHIYFKAGGTGTFLRNDKRVLSLWSVLSTVVYRYPAKQAIEDGYLTPIKLKIHNIVGDKRHKYATEYTKNYSENICLLDSIYGIVMEVPPNESILILVKLKEKTGKVIFNYLRAKGIESDLVTGDVEKTIITEKIDAFNEGKIHILIGSSVISEGIDIVSTTHLIYCKGGKSRIEVVQGVGRLVRLHPKKKVGILHDFNFEGTKHLSRHTTLRRNIIEYNFNPISIEEVEG